MAVLTIDDCMASRSPGRLIRRIDKMMSTLISARFDAQAHDLSLQHWIALKVVRDGTVGNVSELSRELEITSGATTRLVDTLEQRGLLERDRGHSDRRVVRLAITQQGLDAITALAPHVIETWNEVIADFDQAEVRAFTAQLERVMQAVERAVARHAAEEAGE
jgi:DNA-binding MarR family transcriptional regulator